MTCFIDMDGVLVNFIDAANETHGDNTKLPAWNGPYGPDGWDVEDRLGMSVAKWMAPFDKDFWANLEWVQYGKDWHYDGKLLLRMCEFTYGKENICLLTAPCMTQGCIEGKRAWIQKHMPAYQKQVLFGSCKEFCAGKGNVLYDDRDSNIVKFAARGGAAMLLPRPWNSRYKDWLTDNG